MSDACLRREGSLRWRHSPQLALMGHRDVTGFGCESLYVEDIGRDVANDIIRNRHYSGRSYNNSVHHFGIYAGGNLAGVIQWGHPINPDHCRGLCPLPMAELNRLWIDDAVPRNAASMAIAYSVRVLRRRRPGLAWVQSYADERCGRMGVVYQAAGFRFFGSKMSTFYLLDGEWYHAHAASHDAVKGGQRAVVLRANLDRAEKHEFRQYHYVRFLRQDAARMWPLAEVTFPKQPKKQESHE